MQSVLRLKRDADQVVQSEHALASLNEPLEILLQVESSARGYALTGNPEFLGLYDGALKRIKPALERIEQLTKDNEVTQADLNSLSALVVKKLDYSRETVEFMRAGKPALARANVARMRGASLMAGVRGLIGVIHDRELGELARRQEASSVHLRRALMALAVSLVLGAGLLLALFWASRRSLRLELAESRLKAESDERFRAFADSFPMIALIKDKEGRVAWMNKVFREMAHGASEGSHFDAMDIGMDSGYAPMRSKLEESDLAALRGERVEFIGSLPGKDGRMRHWHSFKFPVRINGEAMIGINSLEITEQVEADEKLKAYSRELERSNRELLDFASIAAHDLQEPLRKIRSFGDLLEAEAAGTLQEDARDYLRRMQASAGRMQNLIEDLLAYSRVNTKGAEFSRVDLGRVFVEVCSDLDLALSQSGMLIDCGDLPEISADAVQMRQLFQNLISNSVKFRRSDAAPSLEIRAVQKGPQLELSFRDNGIGFDMRFAEKIFTIFQRLHGRDAYEGNGVGLAVCRKIAEHHGGGIRAESTPGQGTAFFVTLPMTQSKGET